ncbi:hypothetical protein PR048_009117 [Dryococelus australis]|uniref:Uncharacterized protein n=1 Tax=Dryococelus australis TaxID=614101 RepID=A0ABQ9HYZ6_9NEOP|nr:hypothetical protein PR048_009117 [Dryococelus australis]
MCQGPTNPSVLLDSADQANFISDNCLSRLSIPCRKKTQPHQTVFSTDAFVLPHVTGHIPSSLVHPQAWGHLAHLQLADPAIVTPGSIGMLLGAELFPYLLKGSKCEHGRPGTPVALHTHFGDHIFHHSFLASSLSPSLDTVVEHFGNYKNCLLMNLHHH